MRRTPTWEADLKRLEEALAEYGRIPAETWIKDDGPIDKAIYALRRLKMQENALSDCRDLIDRMEKELRGLRHYRDVVEAALV